MLLHTYQYRCHELSHQNNFYSFHFNVFLFNLSPKKKTAVNNHTNINLETLKQPAEQIAYYKGGSPITLICEPFRFII